MAVLSHPSIGVFLLWDWCGLVLTSVLETSSWVSPAPLDSAFDVLQICDNCWKDCEGNVCVTLMHVLI